ncbi:hypothetical protein D3C75_1182240 [compost metagenome]
MSRVSFRDSCTCDKLRKVVYNRFTETVNSNLFHISLAPSRLEPGLRRPLFCAYGPIYGLFVFALDFVLLSIIIMPDIYHV